MNRRTACFQVSWSSLSGRPDSLARLPRSTSHLTENTPENPKRRQSQCQQFLGSRLMLIQEGPKGLPERCEWWDAVGPLSLSSNTVLRSFLAADVSRRLDRPATHTCHPCTWPPRAFYHPRWAVDSAVGSDRSSNSSWDPSSKTHGHLSLHLRSCWWRSGLWPQLPTDGIPFMIYSGVRVAGRV